MSCWEMRWFLPVSDVAHLKLEVAVGAQQSLLDVVEVYWLAVDGYELHAALERQRGVLAAAGRTACCVVREEADNIPSE